MTISSIEQLRTLYGTPSGRAKIKSLPALDKHCRLFIDKSPFLTIGTIGENGDMDVSPRGGKAGFVQVLSDTQILIPDAKGNNRLDSLTNIVETGKIGMLFMVPGIDETLRLNGTASLSNDPELLAHFPNENIPPKTVIVVDIEEVFLHCAKAFMRSQLWNPDHHIPKDEFPTMGQMLKDQLGGDGAPETREEMVKRYQKDL